MKATNVKALTQRETTKWGSRKAFPGVCSDNNNKYNP